MFIVVGMKRWMALLVFVGGTVAAFAAEGALRASKPEVKKEIVAVIDAQLAAFRKADPAKAYSYSATRLRAQRRLESFAYIVKTSYPEIWANTGAEYGIVRDDGQQAALVVHVKGKEGEAAYDYRLVKERAGWRISAVLPHVQRAGEQL
jgi:hypothetical protein